MGLHQRLAKYQVNESVNEKKHTLMIVDDDTEQRDMMADAFGGDFRLQIYTTVSDAIASYRKSHSTIDLIVLDMKMEGTDPSVEGGEEVFQSIKQINPQAAVIISTGYTERDMKSFVERFDPKDVYYKGTSIDLLMDKVKRVLNG